MSIDTSALGAMAAELMDSLEADGIEGEIDMIGLVVAIDQGDDHLIRVKCSDERGFVQSGLFRAALLVSEMGFTAQDTDDDE